MRAALALATLCLTSGCFTTRYLLQAAGGQYELVHKARSLTSVRDDPTTSPRVKALLAKVPAIKRFGQLRGLTPTKNYETWVDLERTAAVYVVQGCAPLQFAPRRWTFPIVGTVPYLGFFDEAAARAFAKDLQAEEAIDVTVRTAGAYSTLGWFRDPVLSTMLPDGPEAFGELVNVILHESVHATVYVPGQSAFDESLASFIADELTWELVVGRGGPDAKAWLASEARGERFLTELRRAHDELDALYRSPLSDAEKLAKKGARLVELQQTLRLKRPYNNADLAGVRTYDSGRGAFQRLARACGAWARVLDAVRTLKPTDFAEPQQARFDDVIDALAQRACPSRRAPGEGAVTSSP